MSNENKLSTAPAGAVAQKTAGGGALSVFADGASFNTALRMAQCLASSTVLSQMIEGPWNNDACKGYAIMAMVRAGLDPETIRKVSSAMTDCFDDTTVAEAGRYYVKGAVR